MENQEQKILDILILEDVPIDAELIDRELKNAHFQYRMRRVASRNKFIKEIETRLPDVVLADYSLPQFNGLEALKIIKEKGKKVPFILVTGLKNEEIAVECLKQGADDYILKSSLRRLPGAIVNALEKKRAEWENERLEEELQRYQKQILNIFDSITDAFFAVNESWEITYLNPRSDIFLRKFDKRREELWGKNWWNEFPANPDSVSYKSLHRAMSERISIEFEEYYPSIETWVEIRAYPSEDGLAIYMQDITDRKISEEKNKEQAHLLDIAQDAIFVRDMNDNILYWNNGAERIYGWTREEAIAKNSTELLKTDPIISNSALSEVKEKGSWFGELKQVTKDNKIVIVESRWSLVRNAHGEPKSILTINTDITDKKNMEQQFLRAQRLESVGTLASGLLHDLNNILTPIILAVPFLKDKLIDDTSKDVLRTLETSARRGEGVIRQLMSFVRGIQGERMLINLKHLIWELLNFISETFPPMIKVKKYCPKGIWPIIGDATQLYQMLLNLAINARDAMPNGGTLTIEIQNVVLTEKDVAIHIDSSPGSYVLVNVKDTGIGIPPEIIHRIFDPFFTTKEPGKGTGLGLSSVMTIVKSHGGFIDVQSEVGKGSEFKVYLPAAKDQNESQSIKEYKFPQGRGETILIVDDEKNLLELLQTTLESRNFKVLTAIDGNEAISIYEKNKNKIEVVLLDMLMPNLDGVSTVTQLKKINPDVKIIGMSGSLLENMTDEMNKLLEKIPFLQKPFESDDVVLLINDVISGKTKLLQ